MATQSKVELQQAIIGLSGHIWGPARLAASEDIINLELTFPQLRVMSFLRINGRMRMTDLAGKLGVSLPTATGLVDRLSDKGCVVRTVSQDDRRVVLCDLSAKGKTISQSLGELRTKRWLPVLEQLNEDELSKVLEAFTILAQKAEKAQKVAQSTASG